MGQGNRILPSQKYSFRCLHRDSQRRWKHGFLLKILREKNSLEGLWTGRKGTETVVVDQENVSCALVDVEVVGVSEAESYSHIWVSAGRLDWTLDNCALKLCLSCNQLTSSQRHWHRIFQTYKARVADGLGFTCSEIARFDFYWSIGRCCNRTTWLLTHVHIYNVDSTFIQCCPAGGCQK